MSRESIIRAVANNFRGTFQEAGQVQAFARLVDAIVDSAANAVVESAEDDEVNDLL
jgi:hypothetical protein